MFLQKLMFALFAGALPLFILTFILVSIALHRRWLAGRSAEELLHSIEALGKNQKKKQTRQAMDPVFSKWFSFGGGFYGVVALYTWLLIEWGDVAEFLGGLSSVVFSVDLGGLFELGIELLVESLVNFGLAIAWPAFWLGQDGNPVMLLLAAYAGYWVGMETARVAYERDWIARAWRRLRSKHTS